MDPKECEELCDQFEAIGCKYWKFSNSAKLCSLRTAEDRVCKTWGGPRTPLFNDCVGGNSTTAAPAPTTEAPTSTVPTSAAPTTKAPTTAKPTEPASTSEAPKPTTNSEEPK